jgi:hypothetical protein
MGSNLQPAAVYRKNGGRKLMKEEKRSVVHAVDFDGTLADYDTYLGPLNFGKPIPKMVDRVKQWLKDGDQVVLFTARVNEPNPNLKLQITLGLHAWCQKNIGQVIEVTATKTKDMTDFWDDRAVQVEKNTGEQVTGEGVDQDEIKGEPETGYEAPGTLGPFECQNCEYYKAGSCGQKIMMEKSKLPRTSSGRVQVEPHGCCEYVERVGK